VCWPPFLRDMGNASWGHYCPGCKTLHSIPIHGGDGKGNRWYFNGNRECPTFSPSLNFSQVSIKREGVRSWIACHYTLANGKIMFAEDCGHELAGKTVELPRIPEVYLPVDNDIL